MVDVQYVWGKNPVYIPAQRPLWERLAPYLSQMMSQQRAQKFKNQQRIESQLFQEKLSEAVSKRQQELAESKRTTNLSDLGLYKVGNSIVEPYIDPATKRMMIRSVYSEKDLDQWSDPILAQEGDASGYEPGTWYMVNKKTKNRKPVGGQPGEYLKQFGLARKQGYRGNFMDFRKEIAKAGATNINVGQRAEETAKGRNRAYVAGPQLKIEATKAVKGKYERFDWESFEPEEKDAMILEEMGRQIKAVYPNAKLSMKNGVLGWYVGDRLIQRYE